ncbi:endoplasmic reticulum vesicle transporter-domain-containing protein [Dipodascopsis tothii]|uniref:endoplasmic reticulum vesicle transporter-domain-containing protein n=1 Tax=Dipodascopsis tothii TaxID=44089 RepID=UPI0034CF672F
MVVSRKRLTAFDGFSKTVEDARVRTTSGGVVTMAAVALIVYLLASEWIDYRRIVTRPELIVDMTRGERLDINLNVTFPTVPCALLTLDVMDVSGEQQSEVTHGIIKTRLDPSGKALAQEKLLLAGPDEAAREAAAALGTDYCGPCYGAVAKEEETTRCCQTCDDVRQAYQEKGWAFGDGSGVEQCEREHYPEKLKEVEHEGCNVAGHLSVNKVIGNFHFAPGRSYTSPQMHVHDLNVYQQSKTTHTFSHEIHHLSFGPYHQSIHNPLDGTKKTTAMRNFNYMYFVKVVSTRFEPLDADPVETNQYSVTSHERSIMGGRDEDHPNTMHARGGIPGVFFSYDISPMKVINHEEHAKSFGSFLTGVCAIVGSVLAVAAVVDRGVWEADKALNRKKAL